MLIKYNGFYYYPNECTTSKKCELIVKWKELNNKIEFQLFNYTSNYLRFLLSNNNNSLVKICNNNTSISCNFSLAKSELNNINDTSYLLLSTSNNNSNYLWHKINLKLINRNNTNLKSSNTDKLDAKIKSHGN